MCKILFPDANQTKPVSPEISFVEVLENDKKCVALVHPIKDTKKRQPGIVVVNSRTTKPKCHTCEGKKCVHVNIYMEGASNEDTVEVNVEDDLPTKKMDNKSLNSTNQFDPLKKRGKESNVFCVKINFPPNKSEKNEIDKINRETNLFTEGYAIPDLQPGESCDHFHHWHYRYRTDSYSQYRLL